MSESNKDSKHVREESTYMSKTGEIVPPTPVYEQFYKKIVDFTLQDKYLGILKELKETVHKSHELNRIKIFVEIHLINTVQRSGILNKYLIEDFTSKNTQIREKVKQELKKSGIRNSRKRNKKGRGEQKRKCQFEEYITADTLSIRNRIYEIIRLRKHLKSDYAKFDYEEKVQFLTQIIEITEAYLLSILKEKFDLEIFNFYKIYHIKRKKLLPYQQEEDYLFLEDEKYYQNLCYNDLESIYSFNDKFKIFLYALLKNPLVAKSRIANEFTKHMPDKLSEYAKEVVIYVLESRYSGYLYERAEQEGIVNWMMRKVKNTEITHGSAGIVIRNHMTLSNNPHKKELATPTNEQSIPSDDEESEFEEDDEIEYSQNEEINSPDV